jgi:hypothetical protein
LLGTTYQLTLKHIKWVQNIPSGRKMHQHLPLQYPCKISPNWAFWFENIPSGNPGVKHTFRPQMIDGVRREMWQKSRFRIPQGSGGEIFHAQL